MKGSRCVRSIIAGDLEAIFLPSFGMLCCSLRHRGTEILRCVEDIEAAAFKCATAGITFLYPWANRLAGLHYCAAGREVMLDPLSPLLHLDEHGLPMHGVPWPLLTCGLTEASQNHLIARLDWDRSHLLALFPFRHRLEISAKLSPDGLTLETTLLAHRDGPLPVTFGFRSYVGVPGIPRPQWRLKLPATRRLARDRHGIPTGLEEPFCRFDAPLGKRNFDDSLALLEEHPSFSLSGAGRQITIELLSGYNYSHVSAPLDHDYVGLDLMTAPPCALSSGRGLRFVKPWGEFRAAFRIGVCTLA